MLNDHEVRVLHEINQERQSLTSTDPPDCQYFASIIDSGTIEPDGHCYIVQRKLGPDLKCVLQNTRKKRFSLNTTLKIGIQLIHRLKVLHSVGWLHLDIKPNNIVLNSSKLSHIESSMLALIDFGIAKSYLTPFLKHVAMREHVSFAGNFLFASVNAFTGLTQSRRDDLISLLYLLVFFRNGKILNKQELEKLTVEN